MAKALQVFKDTAIEKERQDVLRRTEDQAKLARMERLSRLTTDFEGTAGTVVRAVGSAATDMQSAAVSLTATAEQTS